MQLFRERPEERWHLRDEADAWGRPVNLLVSSVKGKNGYVAFAKPSVEELSLRGAASDLTFKVQADEDGYIFEEGFAEFVFTPLPLGDNTYVTLRPRGEEDGQQWWFQPA